MARTLLSLPRRPARTREHAARNRRPPQRTKEAPVKLIVPLFIAAVAVGGCATKKYVSREVGGVSEKVDNVSSQVEQTQERVKRTETRIDEVSQQSQAGIGEAKGSAQQAMAKATDAEKAARGKVIYSVTLSNDKVTFPLNRAQISDDAKKIVDETIAPIAAENRGVYLEIEGHTDSTGPEDYNLRLGEQRAEAVRDYLHDQDGIALARMQVISYGATRPIVDNGNRENRAQNRRVVIKVLE
jgi:peptidoglycan-associated lipoprotein